MEEKMKIYLKQISVWPDDTDGRQNRTWVIDVEELDADGNVIEMENLSIHKNECAAIEAGRKLAEKNGVPLVTQNVMGQKTCHMDHLNMDEKNEHECKVARIFEECTGKYHICDDDSDCLDARGHGYDSKAAALRSAANGPDAYTHAVGSGTYWDGVRSIAAWRD
jgi:hypothetical protein